MSGHYIDCVTLFPERDHCVSCLEEQEFDWSLRLENEFIISSGEPLIYVHCCHCRVAVWLTEKDIIKAYEHKINTSVNE